MERALARSRDRQPGPPPTRRRIRLMIVDDSTVARAVLSRMVESDPAFEITAVAGTAEDSIEALGQCRVDVVVLDLEMPGAGGLKSIPRIIAAAAGAKVMIVSSLAEDGAEQTVAALALGAADTMPKPGTGRFNGKFSEILLSKLKALGYAAPAAMSAGYAPQPKGAAGGAPRNADRSDRRSCDRRVDGRNPRAWSPVSCTAEADRRSDPSDAAPSDAVHAGFRPPARRRSLTGRASLPKREWSSRPTISISRPGMRT